MSTRRVDRNKQNKRPVGKATKAKVTTRHFAALDFLRGIPMQQETKIIEKGIAQAKRNRLDNLEVEDDDENLDQLLLYVNYVVCLDLWLFL